MARVAFSPHIGGFGHRVRCQRVAEAMVRRRPDLRVTMLVRRDDPVDPRAWTTFAAARTRFRRSATLVMSDLVVEDGALSWDVRHHLQRLRGGRLAAVVMPYGFDPIDLARRVLARADRIFVPWPRELFRLEGVLAEFGGKVTQVPPVLTPPMAVERKAPVIYAALSRPTSSRERIVREAMAAAAQNLGVPFELKGGIRTFLAREEHERQFQGASLVLTEGNSSVFEAWHLRLPVVHLPRPNNEEQLALANAIRGRSLGGAVFADELNPASLADAIARAWESGPSHEGAALVPTTGADELANELLGLAGG